MIAAAISERRKSEHSTTPAGKRFPRPTKDCRLIVTVGVGSLPAEQIADILFAVHTFTEFGPDNDPHGEEDFGAVEHQGVRYFWKIVTYAQSMQFGSPNPADPAVTTRVLTIMRADEDWGLIMKKTILDYRRSRRPRPRRAAGRRFVQPLSLDVFGLRHAATWRWRAPLVVSDQRRPVVGRITEECCRPRECGDMEQWHHMRRIDDGADACDDGDDDGDKDDLGRD